MKVIYDEKNHVWKQENMRSRYCMTVLTKDPLCKRGEYAEEIDVMANTSGHARNIANIVLKKEYEPDLRVSKIVINW